MKIAVVGATGNIGALLSKKLLAAGHRVRALSRGGPALDRLVKLGAEPFIGSLDAGTPNLSAFFQGVDAAFTMVRSDWSNLYHYRTVAARLAETLTTSSVGLVVNLSSAGGDIAEDGGHSSDFHRLEHALDGLSGRRVVHLRAGWFMENFLGQIDGVIRYGKIASMLRTDLKLPCLAIRDIPDVAAQEFLNPTAAPRSVRELQGSEDLTMTEVAALMSKEIGRTVEAIHVDAGREDVNAEFLKRFGNAETWEHRVATVAAFNDERVRFNEPRSSANSQPTGFAQFLRDTWRPAYDAAISSREPGLETFATWLCKA